MSTPTMDELRTLVRGAVITADDPGYDEARRVQNGRVDRRPKAIVTVEQTADVVACVNHARDACLPLAVRGGGHSGPGYGTNDDGLVIDLSGMRLVTVDPGTRRARWPAAPPGATSTTPPTCSAWPRPAASCPPPGWAG